MLEDDGYLTTNEVARLLKASPSAVIDWANQGKLPSHRTPGNHRRFKREDVEAFALTNGSAA